MSAPNIEDLQGVWWLPGREDHQIPGSFTWDPDTGGTLRVVGRLQPLTVEPNPAAEGQVIVRPSKSFSYPLIHGRSGQRCFTLLDGITVRRREQLTSDWVTESIHIDRALESSALFTDLDDMSFERANVHMRHLTAWVATSGLEPEMFIPPHGPDDPFATITARNLPSAAASHLDGEVVVRQHLRTSGNYLHSAQLTQRWDLQLSYPNPRRLTDLSDTASDVQDLVSIAAGKTAVFEHVTFEHPEVPLTTMPGEHVGDARDRVHFYARWTNRCPPQQLKPHEFFFSFTDFGEADGLARWLTTAATHRTELRRLMATRYSATMYLEDRLMNMCAALESFDQQRRGTSDDVHYLDRVKECIRLAGDPFTALLGGDAGDWAVAVKKLRNDLAHHNERFRQQATAVNHVIKEQLFWLLALCLLRESGAPEAVYASIGANYKITWLRQQAHDVA